MSTTIPHGDAPAGHIHPVTNWVFPLYADLVAHTGATAKDVHKMAFVEQAGFRGYYTIEAVDVGTGEITWRSLASTSFLGLTDTPDSYVGTASYKVIVNPSESGLIMVPDAGADMPTWGFIVGTLADQTDLQNELNFKLNIKAGASISANAGSAAYADLDASGVHTGLPTDPAVLVKGQYGLGWKSIQVTDLNSIYENGFYQATGAVTGSIPGASGNIAYLTHKNETDDGYQFAVTNGFGQVPDAYIRTVTSFDGSALWGSWAKLTHTNNIAQQVRDVFPTVMVAGSNITLDYDPTTHVTTINSAGAGGTVDLSYDTATNTVINTGGTDATIALSTPTQDGLMSMSDHSKLAGLSNNMLEYIQDVVATMTVAGTGMTITYDDTLATLTFESSGGGGGATNLSYTASPTNGIVASDTGTDATVTLVDSTNAGLMAPAQNDKLAALPSNFTEALQDEISTFLVAGANVTLTYDDTANTLTIASAGGGGGGVDTDLAYTASPTNGIVTSSTGTDATLPLATGTNAGLLAPAGFTAIGTIPADLAEYVRDTVAAFLVGGANILLTNDDGANTLTIARNGAQDVSTIANFAENVQDVMGFGGLTAGTNISLNYDDVANTITITGVLPPDLDAIEALTGTTGLLRKTAADTWTLDTSTFLTANQTITLSGDVTGSGTTAITSTIPNDTVTFAKMQNVTTAKLLGRATAGSGDIEEITLGTNLSFTGTTLNASGGGGSSARPVIIECDFFKNDSADWTFSANSSGTNISVNASYLVGHPGVYALRSSTTANSGYRVMTPNTAISLSGGEVAKFVFLLASAAFSTSRLVLGYTSSISQVDGDDNCCFVIEAGVVVADCAINSTRTTSSTMTTLSADVWYRAKIEVASGGASADFTIYDDTGSVIATTTVSSNLPTDGTQRLAHGVIATSSGTTQQEIVYFDYMSHEDTLVDRNF